MAVDTVQLPEGLSGKDLEEFKKWYERKKTLPWWVAYSMGEIWLVQAEGYAEAKSRGIDSFIERFGNIIREGVSEIGGAEPGDIIKSDIANVVGVKRLGQEYTTDPKDVIEPIVLGIRSAAPIRVTRSKARRGRARKYG